MKLGLTALEPRDSCAEGAPHPSPLLTKRRGRRLCRRSAMAGQEVGEGEVEDKRALIAIPLPRRLLFRLLPPRNKEGTAGNRHPQRWQGRARRSRGLSLAPTWRASAAGGRLHIQFGGGETPEKLLGLRNLPLVPIRHERNRGSIIRSGAS